MRARPLVARRALALAAAALALATGLALLADDVRRWPRALHRGDLHFGVAPKDRGTWEVSERIPLGLPRAVLGVEDDVAFRAAAQLFQLGRHPHKPAIRSAAEAALTKIETTDGDPTRRAKAANLLGILAFEDAIGTDARDAAGFLRRSVSKFRTAVRLDPSSDEAKVNLELVLKIVRSTQERIERQGGARGSGTSAGAGLSLPGRGY